MPGSLLNPKTGRVEKVAPSELFSPIESTIGSLFPPRLPSKPDLGPRFRPTPYESESLDDAMARMNEPMDLAPSPVAASPMPSPSAGYESSGGGMTVNGPTDWAAEREGFLSRGSSPEIGQMADAMGVRQDIDENMMSGRRPDLMQAEQNRLAITGLRNARQRESQQLDPGFARSNRALDDISEAETFMNPRVMGQRQQQQREGLGQARDLQNLDIEGKTDPRVLGLLFQQWMQQQKVAGINASGRNPLAGILGGGGQQPGQSPQGAAPGASPEIGAQRRTRSGQIAVWDGQGWAIQE